jgi:hypothetical protein
MESNIYLLMIVFCIVVFTVIIYSFTNEKDWNLNKKPTFIESLYIVCVNISTIGYGDIYPISTFGRIILSSIHFIMLFNILYVFESLIKQNHEQNIIYTIIKNIVIILASVIVLLLFTNNNDWHFPVNTDKKDVKTMTYFVQTSLTTCGLGDIYPKTEKSKAIVLILPIIVLLSIIN